MGQTFTAETQRRGENVSKSDYRKDHWRESNSLPPPLTPPTRGGGKTFPPPRWGRSGGGAELLRADGKQPIVFLFSVSLRLCGECLWYLF